MYCSSDASRANVSGMIRVLLLVVFLCVSAVQAEGRVYVLVWFDTEDYIEPSSDDAALRLATDLHELGVKATFKVVGEKARMLEKRGRKDVIRALRWHEIGYHTDYHSVPPAPAVYLRTMGFVTGADEFVRRERTGVGDVSRILGMKPTCYGQPGSSWAPQTNSALLRLGIPMYLDEGSHVGVGHQPFWYGGLFYVFDMGPYVMRASLDQDDFDASCRKFDRAVADLSSRRGGVISIYYHPCEFATTEFWDGVNFSHGADPDPSEWKRPRLRTREDSERCYQILNRYVKHALANPAVRFVTASQLMALYGPRFAGSKVDRNVVADHMAARQTFLVVKNTSLSAADMLLLLLGVEPQFVEGPVSEGKTTYTGSSVDRRRFEKAKTETIDFIKAHHRLPATVWLGSDTLSLEDFAATLAADAGGIGTVAVRKGNPEFRDYVAKDPERPYSWVIHPQGFRAPELLDLARLQAWTLKPAVLR
jgi:hypothetical protein